MAVRHGWLEGRAYLDTFDSMEFGVEPSMTDYSMCYEHVADRQGASNVYLWLKHDAQVVDLDDSQFQDIEDHVEGDDSSYQERLSHTEGHATAWQHGTVEREAVKGVQSTGFVSLCWGVQSSNRQYQRQCCRHQQPHVSFTHSYTHHPNSWHQPSSRTRPQMKPFLTTHAWLCLASRCFTKPQMVTLPPSCVWLSHNRLNNILI